MCSVGPLGVRPRTLEPPRDCSEEGTNLEDYLIDDPNLEINKSGEFNKLVIVNLFIFPASSLKSDTRLLALFTLLPINQLTPLYSQLAITYWLIDLLTN